AAVAGLVGIMRSGAAYLPIEPGQPVRRQRELLDEAGAALVVGPAGTDLGRPVLAVDVCAEAVPAELPDPRPDALAYVIFTSGSTGRPKGVAVEHRSVAAYVASIADRLGVRPGARYAVCSTLAADLGHTMVFTALNTGGTLVVVDPETAADADAFADRLTREPVDYLKIVPSHLAALLSAARPAAVLPRTALVLGGEAAGRDLVGRVRRLAPWLRIVN